MGHGPARRQSFRERENPLEATLALPPDAELNLRTRRTGDRFCPMGMGGQSQKLNDTFTNLKVPQELRDRIPLLTVNGEIAWFVAPTAGGVQGRIAEPFAVTPEAEHVLRLRWEQAPHLPSL
ncbi:MAG: tRNA lysidine(34) synthetase TilS [Anaerolineae bacterium]|nr:tRNA lysidine(34) synthetase TilS [Anaerolineae bacterium]